MGLKISQTWNILYLTAFLSCLCRLSLITIFIFFLFFFNNSLLLAQSNNQSKWYGTKPSGKFLTDSIKIGYPVKYALSLKHAEDMELIFPDSSYDYSPFLWQSKEYFPTRTDASGSLDSVVYSLISFEMDSVQTLALPVFIIAKQDCTAVFAEPDSIWLQRSLTATTDTLKAKTDVNYLPVQTYFNYGYVVLIIVGALVFVLIIYISFGKRITRQYRLYKISREHNSFKNAYDRITKNIEASNAVSNVENAVVLWKNYMESLEEKPFSTYTTKEIIEVIPNNQLAEALQHTDRVIYGQMVSAESIRYTRILAYVARRAYIEKRVLIEKQKV